MKYYIICKNDKEKIYLILDDLIPSRRHFVDSFSVYCPTCVSYEFFRSKDIIAETETLDISVGAILGGLIGIMISPVGAIIGALLGSLMTGNFRIRENIAVRRFNRS